MRLTEKQLQKYSVETVSGKKIGKVRDVVFETDGQLIVAYIVTNHLWSAKEHLISREQIVHFTDEKMIVDDAVCKETTDASTRAAGMPQPEAAMRTEN